MQDVKVGSREYKIMLKASRFAGSDEAALKASMEFWRDASRSLAPAVLFTGGSLDQLKNERLIRFFDTSTQQLNNHDYIFRERANLNGQSREVTLKFRHPDRYIARARDMSGNGKGLWKTKFEEDIKPPFQQLYSYSTTQEIAPEREIARLKHVMKLFPGLKASLSGLAVDEPLALVENFTARELVVGGAKVQLGKKYNVWAGCVLVLWYDND